MATEWDCNDDDGIHDYFKDQLGKWDVWVIAGEGHRLAEQHIGPMERGAPIAQIISGVALQSAQGAIYAISEMLCLDAETLWSMVSDHTYARDNEGHRLYEPMSFDQMLVKMHQQKLRESE